MSMTIEFPVHFTSGPVGQKVLQEGAAPPSAALQPGKVPRISRLMALAIRFNDLVRTGEVEDFAQIAELGQVTRARVSQIVNLLNLAPDLQEKLLFAAEVGGEGEAITERQVRDIAAEADWGKQRRMWGEMTAKHNQHIA